MEQVLTQDTQPESKRRKDREQVVAQWWENIGGGVGIFAAVFVLLLWFLDWLISLAVAATIGVVVAGTMTGLRAYLDEVMTELDRRAMEDHIDELTRENDLLKQRLQFANYDVQRMVQRQALSWGTSNAADPTVQQEMSESEKAYKDAEVLLERAYAGQKWGRDSMRDYNGMLPGDWKAAITLLESKGIVFRAGKKTELVYRQGSQAFAKLHGQVLSIAGEAGEEQVAQ